MVSTEGPEPPDDPAKTLRRQFVGAGDTLERLGHYRVAWHLLAEAPLLGVRSESSAPEWRGEALAGRSLLVRRRIRHLGAEIRMARFALSAALADATVTVAVEPRLLSLFARSFPELTVVSVASAEPTGFDYVTSWERLAFQFGRDSAEIAAAFRALTPEPARVAAFRARQSAGGAAAVGVAWWSRNTRKALPGIADWARIIGAHGFRWVSLQYDEEDSGRAALSALADRDVLGAPGFDQFVDIDGFAAQVAAVDAVLTISNTTAHMAGMLGMPCVVVLDDLPQLSWPADGATSPFYPSVSLVRARGRPFPAVLSEAMACLRAKLGERSSGGV